MTLTAEQQTELAASKDDLIPKAAPCRRSQRPYDPLPVLDHGFVRVVEVLSDDAAIVQAARDSYYGY